MTEQPNVAALLAQIEAMKAEIAAAKANATAKITLKVGEKGTLCLYHGGRYPIALYASQWENILPFLKSGKVEAFISANAATLARRPA